MSLILLYDNPEPWTSIGVCLLMAIVVTLVFGFISSVSSSINEKKNLSNNGGIRRYYPNVVKTLTENKNSEDIKITTYETPLSMRIVVNDTIFKEKVIISLRLKGTTRLEIYCESKPYGDNYDQPKSRSWVIDYSHNENQVLSQIKSEFAI